MKFAVMLGTRPEVIKLSSIIRFFDKNNKNFVLIHSNQHYSDNLDKIFFEELELPKPDYNLEVGSGDPGWQTGKMIIEAEKIIKKEKPDIFIIQGDTNTVLAGALAASKQQIPLAHVEAGLRSYDYSMPEEKNRVATDHISEFLFAPTEKQEKILLNEGVNKEKIFVVGNTIVDAVKQNSKISEKEERLEKFGLSKDQYILATVHRAENTSKKRTLSNIFQGLEQAADDLNKKVILPIHPGTKNKLKEYNIKPKEQIEIIEPVGYLDFLALMKNASLIITDSGGVQEEACIIKTPCLTIRENTERPETVEVGANKLAGTNSNKIRKLTKQMINKNTDWPNPFGEGEAGKRIIEILIKESQS
jgi:UDP-N-acetylglucosamine 2-epimerase (non-hydrolysing)